MTDSILRSYYNISSSTFVPFAVAGPFTPNTLAPLLWLDASDLTTLFQDSAGTTPVTTSTDPVGKWNDKSGNGNHVTQATSGLRPQYQTASGRSFVIGDGVDDIMASAAAVIPTAINAPLTICIAFEFPASGSSAVGFGFSQYVSGQPGRHLWDFNSDCGTGAYDAGALSIVWNGVSGGACAGNLQEITIGNGTRSVVTIIQTGAGAVTEYQDTVLRDTASNGSGVYNTVVELFANSGIGGAIAVRFYQVVVVGSALSAGNQALLEAYMAGKIA